MKQIAFLSILVLSFSAGHAQIFKGLGKKIKDDAEWRVRQKVDQQVNKTLDTAISKASKPKNKKGTGKKENNQDATITQKIASEKEEGINMGDGYIELSLSAEEVFRGGTVIIQGSSLKYGNLQTVNVNINGPRTNEEKKLTLYENNSFTGDFQPEIPGEYTITVKSSDGKAKKSARLKVLDIELTNWEVNNEETEKAVDKLKKAVERVADNIGQKDKAELEKKMDEVEGKAKVAQKLFKDLGIAMKELGKMSKQGVPLSSTLMDNLSRLNDKLAEQRNAMKQINEKAARQPYDNSICEYLVMLNEACAAFSTFSNVWSKSVATIAKNIAIDKGVPKNAEYNLKTAGVKASDYDIAAKQPSKLFVTAVTDAESLASLSGTTGFAGDLIQFATEHLMRTYCSVFKGTIKHTYEITHRNEAKVTWWKYGYITEGVITLRYPKKNSGSPIKMKGNIEGNATRFSFYQNLEEMDDFKNTMKGRAKLTPVNLYAPPHVSFSSSQNDELGFGALARGIATPAYFNIPVDAEFDTESNTIRIFLNEAIVDFTPMVKFIYGYIAIAAGIPLVTRVDFPIYKARLTLNAVVSKNNELTVTKDAKSNLLIKGNGERHIGTATDEMEHTISYSLTAKNEN